MAVEPVLLGQALAAAEQMPAQRGEGIVQRRFGSQLRGWQAQGVAARVMQAIATLGLADVAGHQGQGHGQLGGQFQQGGGFAFAQFQLQFADFFLLLADHHVAQVQGGFDDHFAFATAPSDFSAFANEIGGEDGLEGFLVQFGQGLGPAFAVELLQVELGLGQVPVVFVALGQAGDALAAGLEVWITSSPSRRRRRATLAWARSRSGVSKYWFINSWRSQPLLLRFSAADARARLPGSRG